MFPDRQLLVDVAEALWVRSWQRSRLICSSESVYLMRYMARWPQRYCHWLQDNLRPQVTLCLLYSTALLHMKACSMQQL